MNDISQRAWRGLVFFIVALALLLLLPAWLLTYWQVALGSWWGLLTFMPMLIMIVWRLLEEERFLLRNLTGYADYRRQVKWRLLPGVF
jgi:protein-S-isoprenylcysteine O-methyltransferase Ste14